MEGFIFRWDVRPKQKFGPQQSFFQWKKAAQANLKKSNSLGWVAEAVESEPRIRTKNQNQESEPHQAQPPFWLSGICHWVCPNLSFN